MSADFEQLAYTVAERDLRHQVEHVREIRSRTGLLLAASSLAASFLGRETFARVDAALETSLAVGALTAFAVSVAASIYVLMPNHDISFEPAAWVLHEKLFAYRADMGEVYRRLTRQLDYTRARNEAELSRTISAFRTAGAALTIEVALLLLVVSGTLI